MRFIASLGLALLLGGCVTSGHPSSVQSLSTTPTLHVADAALASGAPQVALNVANDLLARDPQNVPALLRKAQALAALGQPEQAEPVFRTVLARDPANPDAAIGLGRLRVSAYPQEAETLFLQVLSEMPRNAVALNDLGVARDLQGHHKAAQDAYAQAMAMAPDMVAPQANLGLSLALSGDPQRGAALLQPLAARADASARIHDNYALALRLAGQPAAP